ncbi:MAG: zinc ribbon domain-containing protein [Clostridia bacterium]|nr:zinc ribbon domain-containing protein [Clostridia bacterium]
MGTTCGNCGKTIQEAGSRFCPFCGAALKKEASPAAAEWLKKARAATSLREREKILRQALTACPDDPDLEFELLFIGHERPAWRMDYTIIKSFLLEIYRQPGRFTAAQRDEMRLELFGDPQLARCQALSGDPEACLRSYLQRLCEEYVEVFLEGDSRVMGTWFGLRLDRDKRRRLTGPVSAMRKAVEEDEGLTAEQRGLLTEALNRAFEARVGADAGR